MASRATQSLLAQRLEIAQNSSVASSQRPSSRSRGESRSRASSSSYRGGTSARSGSSVADTAELGLSAAPGNAPSGQLDAGAENVPSPMTLRDTIFQVESDMCNTVIPRICGIIFMAGAAQCTVWATAIEPPAWALGRDLKYVARLQFCGFAILLFLIAQRMFLRLFIPTQLHIGHFSGTWSVCLYRRALAPVVRPLHDISEFGETFGMCTYVGHRAFLGRTLGYGTSRRGVVHLCFKGSSAGLPLTMSASLQDPFAFFTKLQAVMVATNHPLKDIISEYVTQWDMADDLPASPS